MSLETGLAVTYKHYH